MNARTWLPRGGLPAILVAAAVWALLAQDRLDLAALEGELRSLGGWAPAGFVASFASLSRTPAPRWCAVRASAWCRS